MSIGPVPARSAARSARVGLREFTVSLPLVNRVFSEPASRISIPVCQPRCQSNWTVQNSRALTDELAAQVGNGLGERLRDKLGNDFRPDVAEVRIVELAGHLAAGSFPLDPRR